MPTANLELHSQGSGYTEVGLHVGTTGQLAISTGPDGDVDIQALYPDWMKLGARPDRFIGHVRLDLPVVPVGEVACEFTVRNFAETWAAFDCSLKPKLVGVGPGPGNAHTFHYIYIGEERGGDSPILVAVYKMESREATPEDLRIFDNRTVAGKGN